MSPPRAPVLESLLARACREPFPGADHIATLFHLFGLERPAGADWPSAAVSLLGEGGSPGDGCWLHADPVLLKPDMERVLLFDARSLAVTAEEAAALAALFNGHFAEQGWHLEIPSSQRWYLRVPQAPQIVTSPLHEVTGRSVRPFLPRGAEATRWHALLNEIQMLFFQADSNRRREEGNRPPVGGLWLWGGGTLPRLPAVAWRSVYAGLPLARGLASLAGIDPGTADPDAAGAAGQGETLWFHEALLRPTIDADPQAWAEALAGLEPYLETLAAALRRKQVEALFLYPCNGWRYALDAGALRRFWRRRRPLAQLLEPSGNPGSSRSIR